MSRETLLHFVKLEPKTSPLGSEIEHFMSIDREYRYDEVSALFDAFDLAEHETKDRRVIDRCRTLLIAHGFYRAMSQDEIANTFTTSGRPPYEFKRKAVAYTADPNTVEGWQWPK